MGYRPETQYLRIGDSPSLPGEWGIIARQDIPKDTDLGIIRIEYEPVGLLRVELGGFGNHAMNTPADPDEPTANCYTIEEYPITILVSMRDILEGEEILWQYSHESYHSETWYNPTNNIGGQELLF